MTRDELWMPSQEEGAEVEAAISKATCLLLEVGPGERTVLITEMLVALPAIIAYEDMEYQLDPGMEWNPYPRHCHEIEGVWDKDNGEKAGKPCSLCNLWRRARELVGCKATRDRGGKQ